MGFPISSGSASAPGDMRVESDKSAARVMVVPRGVGFAVSDVTGTISAALGSGSAVFAMRLDPASPVRAYVDALRLQFSTIVAYTTPVTAGRRLALYRGSGAAASGGTAIAAATRKHTGFGADSEFDTANGGDIRIATTGALTTTGITWEANPVAMMSLVHVGNAGNYTEAVFEFPAVESCELVLEPGQLLGIRTPVAMDAAGTWQLGVNIQWREAASY